MLRSSGIAGGEVRVVGEEPLRPWVLVQGQCSVQSVEESGRVS